MGGSTHNELWGAPHRARAFELLKIGYALRRLHGGALFDAWLAHVMPHAVTCPSSCSAAKALSADAMLTTRELGGVARAKGGGSE